MIHWILRQFWRGLAAQFADANFSFTQKTVMLKQTSLKLVVHLVAVKLPKANFLSYGKMMNINSRRNSTIPC
jgi:hypothetical protein